MSDKKVWRKSFTLIELLVVVAIMGMLASLAIVSLNNARARARDTRRVADIKQIQTALELFFSDHHEYPERLSPFPEEIGGKCLSDNGFDDECSGTIYMSLVPTNPSPRDDGTCLDWADYRYERRDRASYRILYCLGSAVGSIPEGSHIATPLGMSVQIIIGPPT